MDHNKDISISLRGYKITGRQVDLEHFPRIPSEQASLCNQTKYDLLLANCEKSEKVAKIQIIGKVAQARVWEQGDKYTG